MRTGRVFLPCSGRALVPGRAVSWTELAFDEATAMDRRQLVRLFSSTPKRHWGQVMPITARWGDFSSVYAMRGWLSAALFTGAASSMRSSMR